MHVLRVSHCPHTEVIHVRLFLEKIFAALFSEAHVVSGGRFLHGQNGRVVSVLETSWLRFPNHCSFGTLGCCEMQLLNCAGVITLHLGQFLCRDLVFQDSNSGDLEWVPLHPKLKLDLPLVRVGIHNGLEDVVLRVLDQLYSPIDSLSGIEGADESAEGVQDDCPTSGVSGRLYRIDTARLTCCNQ